MTVYLLYYPESLVEVMEFWQQETLAHLVGKWVRVPEKFTKLVGIFATEDAARKAVEAENADASFGYDYIIHPWEVK